MNSLLIFLWSIFIIFMILVICLNQIFQKKYKLQLVNIKSAIWLSVFWIIVAFVFSFLIWLILITTIGKEIANIQIITFISAYLLEKFLSIDNVFIWFVIFRYFSIPLIYQQKVLFYGIIGSILFRIIIIFFGNFLLLKWKWIIYFFGLFLLVSGLKMIFFKEDSNVIITKNKWIRWLYKYFKITDKLHKQHFFIRKNNILFATPLLVVLIMIEVSDIFFSIDSMSAIFSITSDFFIMITSNIFAIFGLRSIYFLFSTSSCKAYVTKYGLPLILIFIGMKTLCIDFINISITTTLIVMILIISITILLNIIMKNKKLRY
ncbi:Putative membrane-bound redox modulator Alx [Buchnera aphidicola (Eriosoma lanigerum)]|uniref:TerC/Alx family metal homeostasis membrane protein n=1 Tax=Buchnera aphidicola TaxID=9 RepID=UPI003463D0EE